MSASIQTRSKGVGGCLRKAELSSRAIAVSAQRLVQHHGQAASRLFGLLGRRGARLALIAGAEPVSGLVALVRRRLAELIGDIARHGEGFQGPIRRRSLHPAVAAGPEPLLERRRDLLRILPNRFTITVSQ